MKILFLLGFAGFLAFTPVYLYQTIVQPELENLAQSYSNFDQTAQDIAKAPAAKN